MGKKSKGGPIATDVSAAYLPPEPEPDRLEQPPAAGPAEPTEPAEPASLASDVTPAPSIDEPVWDGQHWTHSGRVWDGERWVASPELLADRRAQATERFQLSTIRLLKSLVYAVLSLVAVVAAIGSLTFIRTEDHDVAMIVGLSVSGLLVLIALIYLWGRNRVRR